MTPFDKEVDRSHTDAEKFQKRLKLFGTDDLYPMWVADMEFEAAPAIQEALKRRVEHGVFGYAEPDETLFKIAAQWLSKRHAITVDPHMIHASPSIMTSMSAVIEALSSKGEGVTVMTPVYPPFLEVVTIQERELYTVSLKKGDQRFEIDFDTLEEALQKSKLLLLCNPHNPVGRVWTQEELSQIAALCLRHEVIVISDDAHCDLVMPNHKYHPLVTISEAIKLQSVTLFGPGKGFNISGLAATLFFTHNANFMQKIEKVFKARHIVSGQLIGYQAIKSAYGHSEAWLEALIPYLNDNIEYAVEAFATRMPKIKVLKSEGTYLLWMDCKALGLSDHGLKKFFVEEAHVGLSQGRFFGPGGSGYMRMNVAVPRKKLEETIDHIFLAYTKAK